MRRALGVTRKSVLFFAVLTTAAVLNNPVTAQSAQAQSQDRQQEIQQLKDKLLTTDYTQFNEYQPVVEIGTATAQEVRDAHAQAYRKYYLRPSWLLQNGASTAIRMIQNIAS